MWKAGTAALVLMLSTAAAEAKASDAPKVWTSPGAAFADGRTAFGEKRYADAAEAFEAAYAMDPDPRLAANLGEVYRRLGDCPKALEYFERYLAVAPPGPERESIEARADPLRKQCTAATREAEVAGPGAPRLEEAPPPAPPTAPAANSSSQAPEEASQTSPAATKTRPSAPRPSPKPARWIFGVEGGLALGRWGEARSVSPAVRLAGTRVWRWGRLGLGVGAGAQWSTFGYGSAAFAPSDFENDAQALEVVGELQGRLEALDWFTVRLDVGAGGTWFSGFDTWNEISPEGRAAAAGWRPTVRAALGAEVGLPIDGLSLRVTPAGGVFTGGTGNTGSQLSLVMSAGLGYAL